jgi:hypothetical protein
VRRATHERILFDERRAHERERDSWLRERQDLIDRIMYLADRPWSAPPAEMRTVTPEKLSEEVAWPIVQPDMMTPDELAEIAPENGTG